ncbi:hypothetical protein M7I_5049 [Glarea lozoyensis 74030]|uniref:Uncharacterized protein n=1 Tax=Glarea lozoyensis (strain ATCC 74030 / MF5533) TaxID=1104152 RepID=H0EQU2_GLAL7|nr:hypothetical protein M7I_5049 [Glarea lozoyensis 74030]
MSASSSQASPSEATPKAPGLALSPFNFRPSPTLDGFAIPKGKYYPSNYVSPEASRTTTPGLSSAPAPPTTLQIPALASQNKKNRNAMQDRTSDDVKRKVQKYQRDMLAQAQHPPIQYHQKATVTHHRS